MSDYIKREDAVLAIAANLRFTQPMATRILEFVPSADVVEQKHGKWIQDEHTYSGHWTYNFVCSECSEIGGTWLRNLRKDQMFPYCPFCGSKMDSDDPLSEMCEDCEYDHCTIADNGTCEKARMDGE